jgi:hypothetical protein
MLAVGCTSASTPAVQADAAPAAAADASHVPVHDASLALDARSEADAQVVTVLDATPDSAAVACANVTGQEVVDLCLQDVELRTGGRAEVAVPDGGVDLGTAVMPRCPRADELTWVRRGAESCWYEPQCGPRLVQNDGGFSCCYVTRMYCTL